MDYTNYPLAQRALEETTDIFAMFGRSVPPQLSAIHDRMAEILVGNVAASHEETDALIAGGILMIAPPFVFDNDQRFADDYSQDVQDIVNDLLSLEANQIMSQPVSRISIALSVATIEHIIDDVKTGAITADQRKQVDELLKSSRQDEAFLLPNLGAQKLEDLYFTSKHSLVQALTADQMKNKKDNTGPSKNDRKGGDLDF